MQIQKLVTPTDQSQTQNFFIDSLIQLTARENENASNQKNNDTFTLKTFKSMILSCLTEKKSSRDICHFFMSGITDDLDQNTENVPK